MGTRCLGNIRFPKTSLSHSSSPPHTQRGTGVHLQFVDTGVREEEQGGAEWAWAFV